MLSAACLTPATGARWKAKFGLAAPSSRVSIANSLTMSNFIQFDLQCSMGFHQTIRYVEDALCRFCHTWVCMQECIKNCGQIVKKLPPRIYLVKTFATLSFPIEKSWAMERIGQPHPTSPSRREARDRATEWARAELNVVGIFVPIMPWHPACSGGLSGSSGYCLAARSGTSICYNGCYRLSPTPCEAFPPLG
jgi:hypothetical protein